MRFFDFVRHGHVSLTNGSPSVAVGAIFVCVLLVADSISSAMPATDALDDTPQCTHAPLEWPKCLKIFSTQSNPSKHLDKPSAQCLQGQARQARAPPVVRDEAPRFPQCSVSAQLETLRKSRVIPGHIPRSTRKDFAENPIIVLKGIAEENSVQAWTVVLKFAYLTVGQSLAPPFNRPSLVSSVRGNLRREPQPLSNQTPTCKRFRGTDPGTAIAKQIYTKIQDGDISGAVRQLISDDNKPFPNEEVICALKSKHPEGCPRCLHTP